MKRQTIIDRIIDPRQSNLGNVGAAMLKAAKKAS